MNRSFMNVLRNGAIVAVTVASGLLAAGCGGDNDQAKAAGADSTQANVVLLSERDVAVAQLGAVSTGITLTGSLEPYRKVEVKAQAPGTITGLRADRGQAVRAGAVMASIQAEGIRNAAAGAQAAVAAAQANVALVQQQLESARTLHEAGALSALDYKAAQTAYEAAQAQLSAARAQATSASEQARRTTVAAPFSGVVSERKVEEGEAVNPAQPLFTLVNSDQLELYGQVPVALAMRIKVGQPVTFTLDAYPERTFRGSVARIEPTADPATRQVGVILRLPNPGNQIVGGVFATGQVVGEELTNVVTVPLSAVIEQGGTAAVFVIHNDRVERRVVTLGGRDEQKGIVAVMSGLKAGERLLATPSTEVPEGTPVRMAGQTASPAPAAPNQK